ncbi:coilin [Patella vulgata]|uniref:coilin n=1 Tax=Patella vulgata TaxID=6465 RepID=UPI00217F8B48|nr:coilin [Patella vulgata]
MMNGRHMIDLDAIGLSSNKMNLIPIPMMDSSSDKNSHSSGAIKNQQILSMFNSLQCQLMTLQSTMVSLQMNQNAIQSTVENVSKKVSKINSKIAVMQTNLGIDGMKPSDAEIPSASANDTEETDLENHQRKKKRKKDKSVKTKAVDASEYQNIGDNHAEVNFNISETVHLLQSDDGVVENGGIGAKKKLKRNKTVSPDLNVVSANNEPEVMEISREMPTILIAEKTKKKRKRNRKRKSLTPVPKTPTPPLQPTKDIKMNLPSDQRPNNVKIKFESDSDNENVEGALTPPVPSTSFRVITPEISSARMPSILKPRSQTPNSYPRASNKSMRKMRGLQVTEVLKEIRLQTTTNGNEEDLSLTVTKDDSNSSRIVSMKPGKDSSTSQKPENSKQSVEEIPVEASGCSDKGENSLDSEYFEAIPFKDYNTFPVLHDPPRAGDKIAYKILELSETYSPEVSAYKEAGVVSYDNATKMINLHLIGQIKTKTEPGKFDIPDETEQTDSESKLQEYNIELNWNELIEPKLMN